MHGLPPGGLSYMPEGWRAPTEGPSPELLQWLLSIGLPPPFHITVGSAAARRPSALVRPHVYSAPLPARSVLGAGGGLVVASPELLALQMAGGLAVTEAVERLLEACGTYATNMPGPGGAGARRRTVYGLPALTTARRIRSLLDRAGRGPGLRKVRRALRYVADGSASPRESALFMALTLPYGLGGYGLEAPAFNARVTPVRGARRSASKGFYYCDLFWERCRLAVEYDSTIYHSEEERLAADAMRRNSLAGAGVSVITATNEYMQDADKLEGLALLVAARIGKRIRAWENEGFEQARSLLRRQLRLDRAAQPGGDWW